MPTGEDGEGWPDAVVKEGEQDKMVVEDGCAEAAVEAQGLVDRPMPLQVSDTPGKENEVEGRKERWAKVLFPCLCPVLLCLHFTHISNQTRLATARW